VSSEEETFRRLVVELRILEGTAEALQSRINLVNAALTEFRVAKMTLEGLEKEKEDAPLFVPIGGGSYIKAKLESAEKMIVGLGADVAVEKTLSEAKENLGNRIEDLEKTRTSLWQQLNEVIGKIQDGRAKLEEIAASLREKERPQGVRETKKRT
jgi:prefoldin alpha subunit